jgi:MFS transporter, ACS family, tartrate transporter
MWLNSWHSDKTQERYAHVGVALLVSASALAGASLLPPGVASLALLFICGAGLGSAQGVFWAIPTGFLSRDVASQGITLINLVGNVGSLVGPYVIGLIRTEYDSFAAPVWFVASVLMMGLIFLVVLHGRRNAFA